jgi:fumarate reductase subunit C
MGWVADFLLFVVVVVVAVGDAGDVVLDFVQRPLVVLWIVIAIF